MLVINVYFNIYILLNISHVVNIYELKASMYQKKFTKCGRVLPMETFKKWFKNKNKHEITTDSNSTNRKAVN